MRAVAPLACWCLSQGALALAAGVCACSAGAAGKRGERAARETGCKCAGARQPAPSTLHLHSTPRTPQAPGWQRRSQQRSSPRILLPPARCWRPLRAPTRAASTRRGLAVMGDGESGAGRPLRLAICFDGVREKNVEQLKVLNRAIFPINYQERVYKVGGAQGGRGALGMGRAGCCRRRVGGPLARRRTAPAPSSLPAGPTTFLPPSHPGHPGVR